MGAGFKTWFYGPQWSGEKEIFTFFPEFMNMMMG
jgi:hypothetical protein